MAEVPKPEPRAGELLIRNHATAVTSSDTVIRGFSVAPLFRIPMAIVIGFRGPRHKILGQVIAGRVERAGGDVTQFREGDELYALNAFKGGGYAEYVCLQASGVVALKPAGCSFEEAAAIPFGGLLALHYLRSGHVGPGMDVLIYGASGAVGTAALQLAKDMGARVTGVCSSANVGLVRSLGADAVIDYTKEDFATRGELYEVVFDAVGKRRADLPRNRALKPGGRHISVDDGAPQMRAEGLVLLRQLTETGRFKPVIDRTYGLEEIVAAHRYVELGHKKGNVVVTI